jgi:hypothetical protein
MNAYEKGDRVRVVRYLDGIFNGRTAHIVEIVPPYVRLDIKAPLTGDGLLVFPEEIEPLSSKPVTRPRMGDAEWNERRDRVYARYCKHEKRVEAGVVYAERYGRTSRFAAAFPRREPRSPQTWTLSLRP